MNFTDYDWKPLLVDECISALKTFDAPWMFAGGWAIDLFLGRITRTHSDIDILIERKHQVKLHDALPDWELWVADPPGALRPWQKSDYLENGIQDIWARKSGSKAWQLQIMLFDSENEEWVFKRDRSIRRKLSDISTTDAFGSTYLNPEVQLLYKSKSRREKDQDDFKNAVEKMSDSQKQWLSQALEKVYGQHEWQADLEGPSNQTASDSVYLVEHDPSWSMKASEEIRALRQMLPSQLAKKIEHTGSTAIPGVKAKPIIDILISVSDITAAQSATAPIKLQHYCEQWTLRSPVHMATTFTSDVYLVDFKGSPAVLKVLNEKGRQFESRGALVLRYFAGNGAVQILNADSGAHLLEYAEGQHLRQHVENNQDDVATKIACDVIEKLHSDRGEPPSELISMERNFQSLFQKGSQEPTDTIYQEGARIAQKLIESESEPRALHGDLHHENIIETRRGWLAIDPQCVYGERTYDLANFFYNPSGFSDFAAMPETILRRCRIFSKRLGLNENRILEYAFAYGCLSAAWSIQDGHSPDSALKIASSIRGLFKQGGR